MGVGGQLHASAVLAPGNARYPLYSRLCGPQGRSGQVRKISPPPGLVPGGGEIKVLCGNLQGGTRKSDEESRVVGVRTKISTGLIQDTEQ